MLQVSVIHNNIANCFIPVCMENVISMYCEYMGLEYQAIFTQAYTFRFDKTMCASGRIADGLSVRYDCFAWLESLYQIKVRKKSFLFFSSMISYLSKNIENNNPCIIHMDSYYLRWSSFFQKEHTLHYVLVIDVNREEKTITVIDSIDTDKPENISFEELKLGCSFVLKLQPPSKPVKINQRSLEQAVLKGSYEVIDAARFQEMEEFGEAFLQMFSPDVEFRDKHNVALMATEKMVDELRKTIKGINLFVLWMMWRDKHTEIPRFRDAVIRYRQVMSRWNLFINILYKKSLTGWEDNFYQKAYDIIMEITGLEQEAYQSFIHALKAEDSSDGKFQEENEYICTMPGGNPLNGGMDEGKIFIPVDLHAWMNNKGFCEETERKSQECVNLTGAGEYFVWDKQPERQFEVDGVPLILETKQGCDNMICKGQRLRLTEMGENRKIQAIALICCTEWGASWERIACRKKDGTVKHIPIFIKDIAQCEEENACLFGRTYGSEGEVILQRSAVFVEQLHFTGDAGEDLQEMILPNAENVHILAITLIGENKV